MKDKKLTNIQKESEKLKIKKSINEYEDLKAQALLKLGIMTFDKIRKNKIYDEDFNDLCEEIKNYDMVVLPGGMPGAANLRDNEQVIEIIQSMYKKGKKLAAICAAPIVLEKAGLIKEKNVTSYPNALERENEVNYKEDKVVIDENIITSRGPATAMEFSYTILRELDYEDEAINLEKGMLYKIR